jgi:myo-inositol 2-dehydrogenase/D-chiro-inositol 1-dehydrogenase/scyllo-inositol 2-dehydrogenase (NAD+)
MTPMTLRFCLIGVGRAGLVHARTLCHRIKTGELVALCDANEGAIQEAGDELNIAVRLTDYREACSLPDVDAVIIVTPTSLHRDIACEAARQGKHVFLEKPMALTADECNDIITAVEEAGVRLQVGFMRRFDTGFLRAKEILDSGELGGAMIIQSHSRGPSLPPPWIYDVAKSNGILAEVNSHDFDSVRWLIGSDIRRVCTEAGNFKCLDVKDKWPLFYDNAVVSLRFDNGTIGTIDGTCPCGYGYDARVEILCEKGVLQVGHVDDCGVSEVRLDGTVRSRTVKSWRDLFKDAYLAEMEHFIECVRDGKTPRVTGVDGLKTVEAVAAANRSYLEHRPVTIGE